MSTLGRITALGPEQPWQALFLLPQAWHDYRQPVRCFRDIRRGQHQLVVGVMVQPASATTTPKRVPKLRGHIRLADGATIGFTLFGHHHRLADPGAGDGVAIAGEPVNWYGRWEIRSAAPVDPAWAGTVCPVYPGKRRLNTPQELRYIGMGLGAIGLGASLLAALIMAPVADEPIRWVIQEEMRRSAHERATHEWMAAIEHDIARATPKAAPAHTPGAPT